MAFHSAFKDLATNKTQSMRIVSSSGLGDNEIDEMIKDATLYRSEDARRREVAEAKNKLDGLIYKYEACSPSPFGNLQYSNVDSNGGYTLSVSCNRLTL